MDFVFSIALSIVEKKLKYLKKNVGYGTEALQTRCHQIKKQEYCYILPRKVYGCHIIKTIHE